MTPASIEKLNTCDPRLVKVFTEVAKHWDFVITEGHRDQAAQEAAFKAGKTQLHYPHGNHNAVPSRAVDACPLPVVWSDAAKFTYFAGFVIGIAASMGIKLRWGGDWNSDHQVMDNKFDDLPHFELVD